MGSYMQKLIHRDSKEVIEVPEGFVDMFIRQGVWSKESIEEPKVTKTLSLKGKKNGNTSRNN